MPLILVSTALCTLDAPPTPRITTDAKAVPNRAVDGDATAGGAPASSCPSLTGASGGSAQSTISGGGGQV
jgi:hypothetical protein